MESRDVPRIYPSARRQGCVRSVVCDQQHRRKDRDGAVRTSACDGDGYRIWLWSIWTACGKEAGVCENLRCRRRREDLESADRGWISQRGRGENIGSLDGQRTRPGDFGRSLWRKIRRHCQTLEVGGNG